MIEIDNDNPDAYNNRGVAKYYLKDYSGAIADYTKVLDLDNTFKRTYYNRGLAKLGLNKYEDAILDFTKELEVNPKNDRSIL